MSGAPSQAFRTRKSSRITTIPTRFDTKRGERVVRWSDILQCYGDTTKFVMSGRDIVLFLTDDDLENLTPLRIAYHPDAVLVVVTEDQLQEELSPMNDTSPNEDNPSSNPSSSHQPRPMLTIMDGSQFTEPNNNQVLVVRPRDHHSQTPAQTPLMGEQRGSQPLEMDPIKAIQEELRQIRQQMQQQTEGVQQVIQDQNEELQQEMQVQLEGVRQLIQDQHEESQQRVQRQMEQVQQSMQGQHEETRQVMKQHIDEVVQRSQQSDPREPIGVTTTLSRIVEQLDGIQRRIQEVDESTREWLHGKMDEMQRRMDETLLKIQQQQNGTDQPRLGGQSAEGSLNDPLLMEIKRQEECGRMKLERVEELERMRELERREFERRELVQTIQAVRVTGSSSDDCKVQ